MKLIIIRQFKNNRYGEVFSLSLNDNNISSSHKDLKNLIGSEFEVNNNKYILRGFSAFWDHEDKAQDNKAVFILYKIFS